MANFKVVEIFESINGEGRRVGQLAIFIRLQKCNLNCSYCDTRWANGDDAPYTLMSEDEIYDRILKSGIKNINLNPERHSQNEVLLYLQILFHPYCFPQLKIIFFTYHTQQINTLIILNINLLRHCNIKWKY